MSKIKKENGYVKFPQKEKAFVITADGNAPFKTAIIGVTYPDAAYHIERGVIPDLAVFEYVESGEGEILINGEWQRVAAGDVYVLAPTEAHKYRSNPENPWKKHWINYISDYMRDYLKACGISTGVFHVGGRAPFDRLAQIAGSPNITRDELFDISACVHEIIAACAEKQRDEDDAERIKTLLSSAIYDRISLDAIAEKLHVSKSGVIRIFKRRFGISPYEFLLRAKIEVAKTLLRTTRLSVKSISEKLKIFDEHYFSTLFYKKVGIRPLDYRKQEQK